MKLINFIILWHMFGKIKSWKLPLGFLFCKWQSMQFHGCSKVLALLFAAIQPTSWAPFIRAVLSPNTFTTTLVKIVLMVTPYLELQGKPCFAFNSLLRCCDCDLRITRVDECTATDCDVVCWRRLKPRDHSVRWTFCNASYYHRKGIWNVIWTWVIIGICNQRIIMKNS